MKDKVSIVGLGYVGLPLLLLSEEKGINVQGFDIDEEKISQLQKGESYLDEERISDKVSRLQDDLDVTSGEADLEDSDYYVITVPTPVEREEPDYTYVEKATETVAENAEEGATIVLESTVAPGTCRNVVKPIIEEKGFEVGEDVYLAFCPERIDPGSQEWSLEKIPRVLGSISDEGIDKAKEYYSEILEGDIFEASSIEVAEASKVTENSFRDINIAFVNELAKTYDNLGISTKEVIEAASTKPFGFMAHWPGCGVGGHCIPVDPYYLIEESKGKGYDPKLLSHAREINESMPSYTVQRVMEGLNELGKPVKGTKIGLLGLAYKGGVDDTRRSPAFEIKEKLEALGADVKTFDPHVESDVESLEGLDDRECLVIATDHDEFKELEERNFAELIVDGRNMLDPKRLEAKYIGVGSN
jgi:UDP-N-acetyl-D-glucosamine dehydrogenase